MSKQTGDSPFVFALTEIALKDALSGRSDERFVGIPKPSGGLLCRNFNTADERDRMALVFQTRTVAGAVGLSDQLVFTRMGQITR